MKWVTVLILCVLLLSFAVSISVEQRMPARLASHWDSQGRVNGYLPRGVALFLLPCLTLLLTVVLLLLPRIDPLRRNILTFLPYYEMFILFFAMFLTYMHLLTVLWNLGTPLNILRWMGPGLGLFIYYTGILLGHTKRNWFIGIRTPWTLSSDEVWRRTHRLGSALFKAAGVIMLFGVLFPGIAAWLVILPLLVAAVWSITYSYVIYKNGPKNSRAP